MQMKYTLGNYTRERTPTMTVEDFINENDCAISEQYLQDNPHEAHKINDGDLDDVWEWAYGNQPFYREIMHEIYELYLLSN